VRRLALVLLLIFSVTPMASEMAELVVHVLEHGDLAHGASHEQDAPAGEDEHCCSSMFHTCGCHASAPSTTELASSSLPSGLTLRKAPRLVDPTSSYGRGAEAPPHRPPIA
jgi:hypothetical protein